MEPTYAPQRLPCILLVLFLMSFNTFCNADLNKDREKCATQLVGLAGCLPYVGGDAKSPAADCCSGLNEVLQKSKECLCILIKDRNDPSLNLKINATLALGLPEKCHAPANISDCPGMYHVSFTLLQTSPFSTKKWTRCYQDWGGDSWLGVHESFLNIESSCSTFS